MIVLWKNLNQMRIDALEFRKCSYLGEEPKYIGWEICKWEPNPYYKRESEFIEDGEFYHPNDKHYKFVSIHRDCFKHPETSYTIASWDWDKHEDCYELKFCGDRPLNLSNEEWLTFRKLLEHGFKQLNPWWYENSDNR